MPLHIVRVHVHVGEGGGERVHESWQIEREEAPGERNRHRQLGHIISVEDTEALREASAKLDKPFNPFIKNARSSAA